MGNPGFTVIFDPPNRFIALVLLPAYIVLAVILFWPDLVQLLLEEWADGNKNYGIVIPPIIAYLLYEKRRTLRALPMQTCPPALCGVGGGLALHLWAIAHANTFVPYLSLWLTWVGIFVLFAGCRIARAAMFPVLYSAFIIPIPQGVYLDMVAHLSGWAAFLGKGVAGLMGLAVHDVDNMIKVGDEYFTVAEACSGIRYVIPIVLLAILAARARLTSHTFRIGFIFLSIGAVVFANALRIALTFLIADTLGIKLAMGFFHNVSGWLFFMMAFFLLRGAISLLAGLEKRLRTRRTAGRIPSWHYFATARLPPALAGPSQVAAAVRRMACRNHKIAPAVISTGLLLMSAAIYIRYAVVAG